MTRLYRSREGEATAIDTRTQLTTLGSETAPGALTVPAGMTKIVGVIVAAGSTFSATGSATALIRLEGSGLPEGPETLVIGAFGDAVATGSQAINKAHILDFPIPVTAGNDIIIVLEMAGADIGAISGGVTLIFE